jgi:hypothetical protein
MATRNALTSTRRSSSPEPISASDEDVDLVEAGLVEIIIP